MQALSPEQYERLRELAAAWQHQQGRGLKEVSHYNPRLGVDALCFQRWSFEGGDNHLVGALVTPVSLSLVLVPVDAEAAAPPSGERRLFALPSGRYAFQVERLASPLWLWRCELLDDLSDLATRQEASRLAQQLMDRVMTPAARE